MNAVEQRRVRRLTASLVTAWLLPVALLLLLSAGAAVGAVPVAIAALLALLPVPMYLTLVLALDRFEREPPRLLLLAFVWGATGALFFSLFMYGFSKGLGAPTFFLDHLSAPVFEEIGKAAIVVAIYQRKRAEFDGVVDGIVYAAMAGLGFAAMENVLYYADAYAGGIETLEATWFVRGLMSPFAHPLFTSLVGIGLGIARYSPRRAVRVAAPLGGLAAGMFLHALWNAFSGPTFLAMYVVLMVPAFGTVVFVLFASLLREGRVIREHLREDVAAGRITDADLREFGTLRGRVRANCRALVRGELRAWRCRRECQQLAADLAFLRRARTHEPVAGGAELADEYAETLRLLRGKCR